MLFQIIRRFQTVEPFEKKDFEIIKEGQMPPDPEGWGHHICQTFEATNLEYAKAHLDEFTGKSASDTAIIQQLWVWDADSRDPRLILQSPFEVDVLGRGWREAFQLWDEFPEHILYCSDPKPPNWGPTLGSSHTWEDSTTEHGTMIFIKEGSVILGE